MDKPRDPRYPANNGCSMRTLTVLILIVMVFQLMVMLLPIGGAVTIYVNNKATFDAIGNISTGEIVANMNNLKDLPIRSIGKDTNETIRNANIASAKVLKLLAHIKKLTGNVETSSDIIDDVRSVLKKAMIPLDSMKDLLSPHMRGSVLRIVEKVMKILDTFTDDEIHNLILAADKAVLSMDSALTFKNVNKTMHVVEDADKALLKFDALLSKFVK